MFNASKVAMKNRDRSSTAMKTHNQVYGAVQISVRKLGDRDGREDRGRTKVFGSKQTKRGKQTKRDKNNKRDKGIRQVDPAVRQQNNSNLTSQFH